MDRCVTKNKKELEVIEAELNRTLKGYTYFITKPNGTAKSKETDQTCSVLKP
jgi:hypothetical protein